MVKVELDFLSIVSIISGLSVSCQLSVGEAFTKQFVTSGNQDTNMDSKNDQMLAVNMRVPSVYSDAGEREIQVTVQLIDLVSVPRKLQDKFGDSY